MQNSTILKYILIFSGVIGIAIGGSILVSPQGFYSLNQIDLGNNIGLFNEIRASAGFLLSMAILILIGAFYKKLTYTASLVATIIFLSYGFSRILSMFLDGQPIDAFYIVTGSEILIGVLNLGAFLKYRNT